MPEARWRCKWDGGRAHPGWQRSRWRGRGCAAGPIRTGRTAIPSTRGRAGGTATRAWRRRTGIGDRAWGSASWIFEVRVRQAYSRSVSLTFRGTGAASGGEPPQHSPGGKGFLEKCGTLVFGEGTVGEGEDDGVGQGFAGDERREQAEFLRRERLVPDGIFVT